MTYQDFARLRIGAKDCNSFELFLAAEGGSVDCGDAEALVEDLRWIYCNRTFRQIRASTGLSQAAFAAAYGIPKRSIENWEEGDRNAPDYVTNMVAFAAFANRR